MDVLGRIRNMRARPDGYIDYFRARQAGGNGVCDKDS